MPRKSQAPGHDEALSESGTAGQDAGGHSARGGGQAGGEASAEDALPAELVWEGADEAEPRAQQVLRALSIALAAPSPNVTAGTASPASRVAALLPRAHACTGLHDEATAGGRRALTAEPLERLCRVAFECAWPAGMVRASTSALGVGRELLVPEGAAAAASSGGAAAPANVEELEGLLGAAGQGHARGMSLPAGYSGGSLEGLRHGLGFQLWSRPSLDPPSPSLPPALLPEGDAPLDGSNGEDREAAGDQGQWVWYAGEFVEDVPQGLGAFRFDDGALYVGACHGGQPHGWGLLEEASRQLVGRFRHGLPHGKAVLQLLEPSRDGRPPFGPRYHVSMREGLPVRARPIAGDAAATDRRRAGVGTGWWVVAPGSNGKPLDQATCLPWPVKGGSHREGWQGEAGQGAAESPMEQGPENAGEKDGARGVQAGEWWEEARQVVEQARQVWSSARRLAAPDAAPRSS